MNERFENLAEQAMVHIPGQTGLHTRTFSLEKFAELIVKECMAQCAKVEEDDELSGVSDGALLCREEIKEHFGVEE